MIQLIIQVLIVGLITMMAGIIWIVARDIFGDDHHVDDKR